MPVYAFKCRSCGRTEDSSDRAPFLCTCGMLMGRDYSTVRMGSVLHGHFNSSVGHYVSGKTDFSESLKRKSDEMSQRLGFEHRYTPVDISDQRACGASDRGS